MSKSGAYYNEFDPKAAAWLRELIKQGHIADGEVDGRSIVDVSPDELRGFTQCHFFAGIGVWSYALRSAGWADDRQVWTESCPCQPFSAAGAGGGFDDERHLWPHWHHLISQCQPAIVFGEQVASKDGLGWLDLVCADLEATGYAVGAADMCAAGLGAPHIRQRLWFVGERLEHAAGDGRKQRRAEPSGRGFASGRSNGDVEHANGDGPQGRIPRRSDAGWEAVHGSAGRDGAVIGLGHPGRATGQRDAGTVSGTQAGEHGAGEPVDGGQPVGLEHASAGVGGVADADADGSLDGFNAKDGRRAEAIAECGGDSGLANTDHAERRANGTGGYDSDGADAGWPQGSGDAEGCCGLYRLADANGARAECGTRDDAEASGLPQGERRSEHGADVPERSGADHDGCGDVRGDGVSGCAARPSPTDGFWRDADWLFCRDGKWRPVEPGTFPLAHGSAARVGRLRGYGNAIAAPVAQAFIESVMEITQ